VGFLESGECLGLGESFDRLWFRWLRVDRLWIVSVFIESVSDANM
jgi:hypothetical protein